VRRILQHSSPAREVPAAEKELCKADGKHPNVGIRIARAKAQRFKDVFFGFLSLPAEEFCGPNHGMRNGQISVQCERMFASGDAFRGAVGEDKDST
jgi:hypothetical protein